MACAARGGGRVRGRGRRHPPAAAVRESGPDRRILASGDGSRARRRPDGDLRFGGHHGICERGGGRSAASRRPGGARPRPIAYRSEEHTSELQSLMRISYAVFCLKQKKKKNSTIISSK